MGCKIKEYSDLIFCYIGETKELHGVGFIIKKKYKNNITNFIGISERVALLQLKFECFFLSIIQAYAPTQRSTDEEIENFYKDIEYAHTKTERKVIIMGDFNAKIGCPKTNDYPVMGKYDYGLRFADDIVIIVETAKDSEEMMNSLDCESSKIGLEINVNKIKILTNNRERPIGIKDALRHVLSLKWRWAGHISRYTDRRWTIEATRWKGPIGKRNVGRQLRRWAEDIIHVVENDWIKSGKDRQS
ncbi:Craniofacial development protein 2 [Eumeta japonica]|uniref:Craniofacial development protein 2 n=1 Tax=Eumeta variegata TaxID=151549 RepID=A0A4C1XRW6_EUMVA|nr:Craniofacial development protein 2 [Eumeta japonica]